VLQVTDARERTLEIRALASAADSSRAWDLRCEVREKLVSYLRRTFPDALPRTRAVIVDAERSNTADSVAGSTASSAD
jgi:hypothetical protein